MSEPEKNNYIPEVTTEKGLSNGGDGAKTKEDFALATVFVSDAQYNRNIHFDSSPQAVRLYLLYNHWAFKVLLYFFIMVNLSLAIFEEPAVFLLPLWATMLVELLCLIVFTARLVHYAKVIPPVKFWKDPKNICIIAVLTLTLVDMIIYGSLEAAKIYCVRWSRVLRPLLLVNVTEGRQVRTFNLRKTAGMQKRRASSCLALCLMLLHNSLLLIDRMPAYNAGSLFTIFFILYILINTYIFMSVFLAVVYNSYKKYLKEEIRQLVRAKRYKMARAFDVLQEQKEGCSQPVLTQASWNHIVRQVRPDITDAHRDLLWSVCDDKNQGVIGKVAFVQLADLLNIEVITLKSRPHPLQNLFPTIYLSAPSRLICRLVQHRGFVIAFDLIILVNAVFIGLDEENPLISNSEWGFLALYMLEILLKLYVFEPRSFFSRHSFWNWFDTLIVLSALIATIINSALKSSAGYTSRQILDIVFVLRVLRLIRVVDSIKRFRIIINTLIRIGPAILTFGQLIVVVYYVFAIVGMELFKNKVKFFDNSTHPEHAYCGNPLLKGHSFAQLGYCKNNFNNVVSSFILLVELTVVNHDGFASVTHVSARIFFVLFHIVVVIVIINIFVAFVLEAFFVEYSVDKSQLQTSLEKKIEELELAVAQEKVDDNLVNAMETIVNDLTTGQATKPNLMFKIASKRYRTVDALLQRMFEADIDPEDFAEIDESQARSFENPVFGMGGR
ncbi:two pore calcium channel protein 1-like [Nothobranchius furzeri]|uniref:Two pore calcium channel protein 1-like n=1 Tax=Nothobranchius furzeri TaxID=105023 RepID=A0A9D2Y2X3_NOTFU|nr:two pore calcium channel protein 1-like [Nothobranchius furzeri]